MSGSTILNQRQHVGLQKLSALSSLTAQFLGPTKAYKFIQDDATGESTLVSSCHRALENLELTCAVGQLVYETIEAHHNIYKTGSGCLLFLAGAWSRAAIECLHLGIPTAQIMLAMSEGMDILFDVFAQCSVPFQELHAKSKLMREHLQTEVTKNNNPANQQFNKADKKLKLCRHFYEPDCEKTSNLDILELVNIAKTLSHGCTDAMDLVIKASQIQLQQGLTFDVTKISACLQPCLTKDNVCVFPGCVVLSDPEQTMIASKVERQDLKMAIIDGDLTPTFRHLGFNKPKELKLVSNFSNSKNDDDDWLQSIVSLLLNLGVNIILISGVADEKLKCHFWSHDILLVEKIKLPVLKSFANSTGAILVSYATQLNSKCIGSGVYVNILENFRSNPECAAALNISTGKNDGLVTVLINSCLQGKLQSLADSFWACAFRLHWALCDKSLLPGAGVTETICICQLQKHAQLYDHNVSYKNSKTAAGHSTAVVLRLMAEGLVDFLCNVMVNTGRYSKVAAKTVLTEKLLAWDGSANQAKFSQMSFKDETQDGCCDERTVFDNVTVKKEVWRKALDLVFLVLQTDAEIITGVNQQISEQDLLFL